MRVDEEEVEINEIKSGDMGWTLVRPDPKDESTLPRKVRQKKRENLDEKISKLDKD